MKKAFRILTSLLLGAFLTVALITIGGCKHNTADSTETKNETEKTEDNQNDKKNDEKSESATKSLDISKISKAVKQSDGSYKISLNVDCSPEWDESSIWFSELQDFSEYKYLILTYKNASNAFRFGLVYSDDSSKYLMCGKNQNQVKVQLDAEKAKALKAIQIFSLENRELTMQIEKLELSSDEEKLTAVKDSAASGKFNTSLTAMELAKNMQVGWNLGNSLECYDGSQKNFPVNQGIGIENAWNEEAPTEEIIKAGITCGYKSIRIPVTWCNHLIDSDYTIDPEWMAHVKQVVDWAISAGYYVILNEHHSVYPEMSASSPIKHCEGYIVRSGDEEESKAFLKAVWIQICQAFNNSYDEHLIFETLNEARNTKHEHEWNPLNVEGWNPAAETCEECKKDFQILNDYNQLVLDTIRASGGNNAKRFVMIPGIGTGRNQILSDEFKMPVDSANSENRLLATIHWYPLSGGDGKSNPYSDYIKNLFNEDFARLNEKFCKKGIPVVVGEFGCDFLHTGDYKATIDDISNCLLDFASFTGKYSMPIVNWDCSNDASIDRVTKVFKTNDSQNVLFPKIIEEWNTALSADEAELEPRPTVQLNSSVTAFEIAKKMECGWNLGNTLDAYSEDYKGDYPYNQGLSSENCWNQISTTEEIIKTGCNNGFKCIRIPVTWYNHIIDDDYTIDPAWIKRVKQVVNWAMDAGYYVILNEHHSVRDNMNNPLKKGEGYILRTSDQTESKAFLKAIWQQITQAFNNEYDEHLIFETMNEPRDTSHEHAWYPLPESCSVCREELKLLNDYNQLILDTIRASGGNNANRLVIIPSIGSNNNSLRADIADAFKLPNDSAKNKLMVTIHEYPLDSGGTGNGAHHFDDATKSTLFNEAKRLYELFISKEIPVVLGEYGAARKYSDFDMTDADRFNCFSYFASLCGSLSMPFINWDVGWSSTGSEPEGMNQIDRKNCTLVEADLTAAIISAWQNTNKNPDSFADYQKIKDFTKATSSDGLLMVEAKSDGLHIKTNIKASYAHVDVYVQSQNKKEHLPILNTDLSKTEFVYPFVEAGKTYSVYLKMSDENYLATDSDVVRVIGAGGLGDCSVSFSSAEYNSENACISLKDYKYNKPDGVSFTNEDLGANCYDQNWGNHRWLEVEASDGSNSSKLFSFTSQSYEQVKNQSFYISILYIFKYEGTAYQIEVMNNFDNIYTD